MVVHYPAHWYTGSLEKRQKGRPSSGPTVLVTHKYHKIQRLL